MSYSDPFEKFIIESKDDKEAYDESNRDRLGSTESTRSLMTPSSKNKGVRPPNIDIKISLKIMKKTKYEITYKEIKK